MSKIYWVTAGSSLTINGTTLNASIVAELGSTVVVNCANMNGNLWLNGNVTLGGNITGNINSGSPSVDQIMGKTV